MPEARVWSALADETIRRMRADGQTWANIGYTLGLSRNTVIERGRRLRAEAPAKLKAPVMRELVSDDPNRAPLPPGHPLTWGLLTSAAYPGLACIDERYGRRQPPASSHNKQNQTMPAATPHEVHDLRGGKI